MSIVGIEDLNAVYTAIRSVIKQNGVLVVSTIHPWFWRIYKKNSKAMEDYWSTLLSYDSFTISLDTVPLPRKTKFVYRSLEDNVEALHNNSFLLERVLEPQPPSEIESLYPEPWAFPRFIFFRCRVC